MNVIVDSLLVNYRRQGKGRVILLLHGWGDSLETFDSLSGALEENFEIIRLDLAGFGKSQAPPDAWTLDDYVTYVAQFTKKVGITPYAMVGHSNGGAIAIRALASGMLDVQKLVLLSSAGIRNVQSGRKALWRIVAKVGNMMTLFLPQHTRRSLRARLYRTAGSDLLLVPHMETTFKQIVSEDVQDSARKITSPTMIISGKNDTATPPEYAQKFHAAIVGSRLVLIDGADHFAHQNKTAEVSEVIKGFMQS